MKSVRTGLLVLLAVLALQLLVALAVAPLLPYLLVALVLTGIFSVVIRGGG